MAERYSDFNSMIERYEQEMRRLFEEKQRIAGFEEPKARQDVLMEEQTVQTKENNENIMAVPEETKEEKPTFENKTGKIIVEVTTGRGAVPISDATVIIDRLDTGDPKNRKELIAIETTDRSGRTKPVEVAAAERGLSLEPGNPDPFTTFYVTSAVKGFESSGERPVDVFADEISILKIDLIPKPEDLSGGENGW